MTERRFAAIAEAEELLDPKTTQHRGPVVAAAFGAAARHRVPGTDAHFVATKAYRHIEMALAEGRTLNAPYFSNAASAIVLRTIDYASADTALELSPVRIP